MGNTELKAIDMTAKFTNFQVINKDFTRCRCNVFYTGRNRNYSDITESALQKFIARKGYANVPVVAHLMKDGDGKYYIGGHDSKIVIDNNGIELVNECVPFGVIPEDCNPSMDLITERSGEQRKYFSVDIILWTHRYPIMEAAYSDEIYFNQSMEIFFEDYEYDNEYVIVNDFSMSALCLLRRSLDSNENIEPCFESSRVKAFSIDTDKFKQNFELMLEKLKQYESDGATTTVQNNEINKPNKEEKQFMDLEKLKSFLSTFTFKDNCNNDVEKYALLSDPTETTFTVIDKEDNFKVYTVEFALDDEENIVADWDAKVEKKFAIVNAVDESSIDLAVIINEYAQSKADVITEELTISFNAKIDEMAKEYEDLSKELETSNKKLADFEEAKAEADRIAHREEINNIVTEFAKKIGRSPKFLIYKAKLNVDEATVDKVTQDLTLMAGQEMIGGKSTNFSYQPQETNVTSKNEDEATKRYGHLLDKWSGK